MCRIRGREISMIFQDSMTSLNPVLTIGRQLEETISVHSSLSKDEIKSRPWISLQRLVSLLLSRG